VYYANELGGKYNPRHYHLTGLIKFLGNFGSKSLELMKVD
jgi:hypothetical protein